MVDGFLEALRRDEVAAERVVAARVVPAREARTSPLPPGLPPALRDALTARGIERLWAHQARAFAEWEAGRHLCLATPTASGKSLCYNLPVLRQLAEGRAGERPTALYLFPTKALGQDQVAELQGLMDGLGAPVEERPGTWTYDGDTPAGLRRILREKGEVIVTNPYMLHVGILPNHARWGPFLSRLGTVVIDELHVYQGVFGSSFGNVLRRLKRLCRRYGSDPRFIACSATIPNPREHFERLVEEPPEVLVESGAPRGEIHHLFWNPPVVNEALGLRARAVDEARRVARMLLEKRVPSIFFARSRTGVELLVRYLKELAPEVGVDPERVVGYRGGYLPDARRAIERGLRAGEILAVCATNALELGVDIGSLDAVVMTGYPGSIASYRQQAGRAGRRSGQAVAILIGASDPLDQHVLRHPEIVLEGEGQAATAHPDNLVLLTAHVECAAFESPFEADEAFGRFAETPELLELLSGPDGKLLARDGRYHWMSGSYPAEEISLDLVEADVFNVARAEEAAAGASAKRARSLGTVDRRSAATTLHPEAIYVVQGETYQVETLDWEGRRAWVKPVSVDYYTQAETETDVQVLSEDARRARGPPSRGTARCTSRCSPRSSRRSGSTPTRTSRPGPSTCPPRRWTRRPTGSSSPRRWCSACACGRGAGPASSPPWRRRCARSPRSSCTWDRAIW
jgi:DEAD/DEAH box helicase domain-containing protein